jgi:hypothetical protein
MSAQLVAGAAIVALPTVILVLMYGQSRIFFVMARDGLLPERLSRVSKTRGTPVLMTVLTGIVVAVLAATLKLDQIVLLANAGTLCAFIAVALCMLVLRLREPNRTPRVPHAARMDNGPGLHRRLPLSVFPMGCRCSRSSGSWNGTLQGWWFISCSASGGAASDGAKWLRRGLRTQAAMFLRGGRVRDRLNAPGRRAAMMTTSTHCRR